MHGMITLTEMASTAGPGSRFLGLDLGTKTIGLAVASWPMGVATPLKTLRRQRFQLDAAALMEIVGAERITYIVLGLPLNMDGSEGPKAQSTRAFVRNLQAFHPPPILLFDERLTSVAADEQMRAAGLSGAKRAEMIDAMAAKIILQDALNQLSQLIG